MNIKIVTGICMDAFFLCLLGWCTYTDQKRREITNTAIVAMLLLGIAKTIVSAAAGGSWWAYVAGLLAGIPFLIAWLKNRMGGGDVKLILAIGLYLGLLNTLVSFTLMIPLLVILMVYSWRKNKTVKNAIPFAPILAFGAGGAVILGYLYALMQF